MGWKQAVLKALKWLAPVVAEKLLKEAAKKS